MLGKNLKRTVPKVESKSTRVNSGKKKSSVRNKSSEIITKETVKKLRLLFLEIERINRNLDVKEEKKLKAQNEKLSKKELLEMERQRKLSDVKKRKAMEESMLKFVQSKKFKTFTRDFIKTAIMLAAKNPTLVNEKIMWFKRTFLEHSSKQIRTHANRIYKETLKEMVKK